MLYRLGLFARGVAAAGLALAILLATVIWAASCSQGHPTVRAPAVPPPRSLAQPDCRLPDWPLRVALVNDEASSVAAEVEAGMAFWAGALHATPFRAAVPGEDVDVYVLRHTGPFPCDGLSPIVCRYAQYAIVATTQRACHDGRSLALVVVYKEFHGRAGLVYMAHEFGHVLGVDHSPDEDSLMYKAPVWDDVDRAVLKPEDVRAVDGWYPGRRR